MRAAALSLLLALALLLASAPAPIAAAGAVGEARDARAAAIVVPVSVDEARPGPPVAPDFLGLSFELSSLSHIARYAARGNFVTLLHSLGIGLLRFGGVTADEKVAWSDGSATLPAWSDDALEAGQLQGLGSLAAVSGWHILLTIGLGHYEPESAAREASAAKAALGPWLTAIELGNEPNSYARHDLRPEPWTLVQYEQQVAGYRGAIEALAPGIPLAGPDVSGSSAFEKWGAAEVVDERPVLLTGHHYPLGCRNPTPTIARLLSPQIRRREIVSLARYMSVAELAETPFRLDETNTVSCGGVTGVSDTFASALWAISYLTEAMSMGVAGVNLQGNPANCAGYTPLCAPSSEALAAGGMQAQPEWYALLLAKGLIGDRPLPTATSSPARANVYVQGLQAPDGTLRFVLVDDDPPRAPALALHLHVGRAFAGARILALTAPAPEALSGVRLGGRAVAGDGSWSAPARLPHARDERGVITVFVKPSSAALLSVSPRPRELPPRARQPSRGAREH